MPASGPARPHLRQISRCGRLRRLVICRPGISHSKIRAWRSRAKSESESGEFEATTVGVVARDRANNAGESNIRPPRCCGLSIVVQKKRMPRGGVLHTIQNSSSSIAAISAEQSTRPQADRHWVDGKAGQEPAHVKSNGREAHEKFCCERCAGVGRGPVREWDRCCRGPGWSPSAPVEFIVPARRSAVAWLAKFLRRHNIFVRNPGRLRHIGEISLVYWHIIYQTPPSCPV